MICAISPAQAFSNSLVAQSSRKSVKVFSGQRGKFVTQVQKVFHGEFEQFHVPDVEDPDVGRIEGIGDIHLFPH